MTTHLPDPDLVRQALETEHVPANLEDLASGLSMHVVVLDGSFNRDCLGMLVRMAKGYWEFKVGLNPDFKPTRRRLLLAHLIAVRVLDPPKSVYFMVTSSDPTSGPRFGEPRINDFVLKLLLPEGHVRKAFADAGTNLYADTSAFGRLAARFEVSVPILCTRAAHLGLL